MQEFYNAKFNTSWMPTSAKTTKVTGTVFDEDINLQAYNLTNKGLTINAGAGNDTIRGTQKADTITGGAGNNVINYVKGDGNDVINLTKNENLTINMSNTEDVYTIDSIKFAYANKNKDLRIYTDKNSTAEFITIKNFASKDVNGNGNVFLTIGKKTYNLETSQDVTNPVNPVDITLYKTTLTGKGSNFTGTWLNDEIDASAVEGRTQKVKKQVVDASTNKGLTLNGGNGNDTITGSKYSDTINGGNGGNDTIDDIQGLYTIHGNAGNDAITGTGLVYGDEGDDTIRGAGKLYGGIGNDTIISTGRAKVGTANNEDVYADYVEAGDGNDDIIICTEIDDYGGRNVEISGGSGNDSLSQRTERWDWSTESVDYDHSYYYSTNIAGTIDMGAGKDHVALFCDIDNNLSIDGGVGDDIIEFAAPKQVSNYKKITITNSGGHDAVNLVSAGTNAAFDYAFDHEWNEQQQQYVMTDFSAPIAFFDMTKNGNNWTYGDDIYICSTKPSTYADLTYQYIGDKENSVKFENGLVADHDFDIYIKNNEGVAPFDYGSSYHYKNGYRKLDIDRLKVKYAETLATLNGGVGYTSLAAALNEADATKQAANREALATAAMAEDVWVYTLERPAEFSVGNFYDGSGGTQYYRDFAKGTGAENNLVAIFGGQYMTKDGDSFLSGTDAKEYIYSTLNANDIIRAGGGDDVIYGGSGDDKIYAGTGNNRIVFCNNYYLERGYNSYYGSTIDYVLREGAAGRSNNDGWITDGHDIVYNDGGVNTLDFSENNMVKFDKVGNDLKISYAFEAKEVSEVLTDVATSTVTVKDYFDNNGNIIENHSAKYIKFKNRGVVNLADEYNNYVDGDKYVWGTAGNDNYLNGDWGKEYIYGGSGNDIITAGAAHYLDGGVGNDTYKVTAARNTLLVVSDSGYNNDANTVWLTDTTKGSFKGFYDVHATKSGGNVTVTYGDSLYLYNDVNFDADSCVRVDMGYTSLLNEDFDTSGYDYDVTINKSDSLYHSNYEIRIEGNDEYTPDWHTSASTIIEQTQSWLTSNYDAVAGVLGEGNVSTVNLMTSTADGAAALQAGMINSINNYLENNYGGWSTY